MLQVIYFHSLSRRARRYAKAYASYFGEAQLVASSGDRDTDVAALRAAMAPASETPVTKAPTTKAECLVIGGDGSLNIAVNAFAYSAVSISLIAVGTGNDFARHYLNHTKHRCTALKDWRWRMRAPYQQRQLALGKVATATASYYFINHAGCGLSVDLMHLQPPWMKRWLGSLSYTVALLRYLFGPLSKRTQWYSHASSGQALNGQLVVLGRFIGGGLEVYPQADRQRGELRSIEIPLLGRWQQLAALIQVKWGGMDTSAVIDCRPVTVTEEQPFILAAAAITFEVDGDIVGEGPVAVSVCPQAIKLNLPIDEALCMTELERQT